MKTFTTLLAAAIALAIAAPASASVVDPPKDPSASQFGLTNTMVSGWSLSAPKPR